MPALVDIAGKRFGRLTVQSRAGVSRAGKPTWLCFCDCGRQRTVVGSELRCGHTTSCGCWRAERNRTSDFRHGMHGSATYKSWEAMKNRCSNPASKSFADYGGRGVSVCERWASSFSSFLADMGVRPPGKTIDRWPDVNGNYEPGNCRWATRIEQQRNTTKNVFVTFNGETLTQAEWSERTGIKEATLSYRLRAGWTPEQALHLAPRLGNRVASKLGDEVDLP